LVACHLAINNKAAMHIFHANTLLNPKCSFGISAGITMGINIISGNNTLKLNLNDLLDASTSTNILKVLGDSGDTVSISDFIKVSGITRT
jgi:hypothetical protein